MLMIVAVLAAVATECVLMTLHVDSIRYEWLASEGRRFFHSPWQPSCSARFSVWLTFDRKSSAIRSSVQRSFGNRTVRRIARVDSLSEMDRTTKVAHSTHHPRAAHCPAHSNRWPNNSNNLREHQSGVLASTCKREAARWWPTVTFLCWTEHSTTNNTHGNWVFAHVDQLAFLGNWPTKWLTMAIR